MRQRRLLACALLVGMLSSMALAGGPFGIPMSTLDTGQWAVDAGYWFEEMELDGGHSPWLEFARAWEYTEVPEDGAWGDPEFSYMWDKKIVLEDFKTNTYVGSLEYGFCENLDLYVRLGATSAEADIVVQETWIEDNEGIVLLTEPGLNDSFDFGTGFTWQVGTRFTICRTGAWTWGGRMQFGRTEGGDAGNCYSDTEDVPNDGFTDRYVEVGVVDADIDWWQAVAYIGPSYQLSDALQVYVAGGWQTLQGTLNIEETWTEDHYQVTEVEGEEVEQWVGADQFCGEDSLRIKHASPIAVFGAAWSATSNVNIGVDALIGEAGKWGIGVSGAFAF
ncbi:MAG: hypothetical protein ABFD90_11340 [Phycisphaerales bacterium]